MTFDGAHNFVLYSPSFHAPSGPSGQGFPGIDILLEASSPEAAVDSRERTQRRCFPGTREQYIIDITNWVTLSNNGSPLIYWMKGPAGVGKSSIAQSCAEALQKIGQLGAAFFFTVKKYDDPARLFTTLAYQLSTIFPDYHAILNDKISRNKTLVAKTMSSQFQLLIVEPLRELEMQGKGVGRRAVIIDGLDECADKDSQVEIVYIVASSVQARSTPFCWAFFSREEPHIVSTFATPTVSSHCYSVLLPISRKADREIELYLCGGFKNILQRRNLLHLSSSWPTNEHIKKLVNAAAGLFAHPATVLRFIDRHSYSGFQETLEAVLTSISKPGPQDVRAYTELDGLYTLILQRVPDDILPPTCLLLTHIVHRSFKEHGTFRVNVICNTLGIPETVFRSTCQHLQAVIAFQEIPQPTLDQEATFDLERPYYDQESTFKPNPPLENRLLRAYGLLYFHHKSFYDFLIDPARSSNFCVTTLAMREKLLDHLVQQHLHYASSYAIQGQKLVLAPGVTSSSTSLSWAQGSEFADSFVKLRAFNAVSLYLSHDSSRFGQYMEGVPSSFLKKLAALDYRKYLVAAIMRSRDSGLSTENVIAGVTRFGLGRVGCGSEFMCINKDKYDLFDPPAFLEMIDKLEKAGVIRAYHPSLGSSWAASILCAVSRPKPRGNAFGQYKLGRGEKSVVWYWEFDTEMCYFHEFQTLNYPEAMALYKAEKFRMWEDSWVPPSQALEAQRQNVTSEHVPSSQVRGLTAFDPERTYMDSS